jgi:hypothetical protein
VSATPAPTGAPSGRGPFTTASGQPLVDRVALGTGDLGSGWSGGTIDKGATLSQSTLDLCDRTAPSDALRVARRQTEIDSRTTDVSTEVVAYRSGGAAQALREAAATARNCTNVTHTADGQTDTETVMPLAAHAAWGTGAVAVSDSFTNAQGAKQTTYTVYQAQGDVLAAVYDFGGTASQALMFQLADLMSARLRAVLAGSTPPQAVIPVPAGPPLDNGSDSASAPGTVT